MQRSWILAGLLLVLGNSLAATSAAIEAPGLEAALNNRAWIARDKEGCVTAVDFVYGATDADLRHIAGLSNLVRLSVCDPRVTDAGLAHVRTLTSLKRLYLGRTGISDAGLAFLAELHYLEDLDLEQTLVSDAGLVHLKGMQRLQFLDLSDTRVTDAGLRHLAVLKNLRRVSVSAEHVKDEAVESIERMLPDIDVWRRRRPDYAQIVKAVAEIIPQHHLSHHPLDAKMSRRWFDNFLQTLDPRRMYFTRQDVDQFSRSRSQLGDLAANGDIQLPRLMRDILLHRIGDATTWAEQYASANHDFAREESLTLRHTDFASDQRDLRERWRKWVKYELLTEKADGIGEKDAIRRLVSRYERLRSQGLDDEELIEMYLTALAKAYDPEGQYFGERTLSYFSWP